MSLPGWDPYWGFMLDSPTRVPWPDEILGGGGGAGGGYYEPPLFDPGDDEGILLGPPQPIDPDLNPGDVIATSGTKPPTANPTPVNPGHVEPDAIDGNTVLIGAGVILAAILLLGGKGK